MSTGRPNRQIERFLAAHASKIHLCRLEERALIPEFSAAIDRLRLGDPTCVEWAVAYMELDPLSFHSGYVKQKLARYLRQIQLENGHKQRLREVILNALRKGNRND